MTEALKTKTTHRQQLVGRVVSDKMQKTIVVVVETTKRHRIYKKTYRWTKRYKAHDETNSAHIGDLVRIEEHRPLSHDKRWMLVEILASGNGAPAVKDVATADVTQDKGE